MLCGWFAVPASGRNRDSLFCSENRFFSWLEIQAPNSQAVYADCPKLPLKLFSLATRWSLRAWPCVLQGCPLCSCQDSRCPSKASGLVRAIASCLQAVCRFPRCCGMDGHGTCCSSGVCVHTDASVLSGWFPYFSVLGFSLEAASILLNGSTPGNDVCSTGKVVCSHPAQGWFLYSSLVVSLVSTWWSTCPFGSLLGPLALTCDHCFSVSVFFFLISFFVFVWSIRNNLRHGLHPTGVVFP